MTPIDELKIFYSGEGTMGEALRALASASLTEIDLILDKINYYIEHLNIVTSSDTFNHRNKHELKTKEEYLKRIQSILLNEIDRRNNLSNVNI